MISESGEGLEADTKCNTSPRRGCVPCPRSAGAGFFYQCWAAGGREEDLQLPPVPVSAQCVRELLLESRLRIRGVGWGELLLPLQPAPPTKDEHFAFQQRAQEALELSITTRLGLSKTTPILCKLQPLPTAFVSVGCCGAACSLAFQRSDPTLTAARTDSSGKTRRWHEGSSGCDLLNLECEQRSSRNAESLIQRLCKAVRALLWHPVGSVRSP